jgi:hypothetical protein
MEQNEPKQFAICAECFEDVCGSLGAGRDGAAIPKSVKLVLTYK